MEWKDEWANDLGRMDDTHREFVEHYNAVLAAGDDVDARLARLDEFIAHTEAHFAQENAWMEAIDFPACHRSEHERVLAVIRSVRERYVQGDRFLFNNLMKELPAWFENHTNGMDAALAFTLNSAGFDFETLSVPGGRTVAASCSTAESSVGSSGCA